MASKISIRRATFEFLSIVVAVVLAMALTEWRQDYLNRKLAQQSLKNIIEEVSENRRELMNDSSQVASDIKTLDNWLALNVNDTESTEGLGVGFSFSFLGQSALEVAKINNSLTYLPNEVNMEIAEIYAAQEFYSENAVKLFDILGNLGPSDSFRNFEEFKTRVRQLRFHMDLVNNTMYAYLRVSQGFLEKQKD
ncbi:hypothetical protein [Roseivirga sp.]|uniref:hypothetical protein n=1 Tax=Roseivirga sp. TaxID=1964215 RepID=UPI003B520B58